MSIYQALGGFKLPKNFRGAAALKVQTWWLVQSIFFVSPPQFMYRWRVLLLKAFGAQIGRGVIIRPSVKVTYLWSLTIGDNPWFGDGVELYTLGEISNGKNAVASQKSYLCTGSHDFQSESFDIFQKPIVIEDEAWVATDVYIPPGVTIGKGAVIGARSSVFTNMPAGMICIGSPAKPIKPRMAK